MGRQAQSDTEVQTLSPISVKYTHPELLVYPPPPLPAAQCMFKLREEKMAADVPSYGSLYLHSQ